MTGVDGRLASYGPGVPIIVIATVGLLLLGAACGGGSSTRGDSSGGESSGPAAAVAYSACVRAHGVPNFPDPGSGGQVPKADAQQLGVSSSRLQAAQQGCAHLIPTPAGSTDEQQEELLCATGDNCSPAVVRQWMNGLQTLAACLRTHGEPHWPDPIITSLAGHPPAPHIPYEQAGIDHHSPQVLAKVQACVRLTGFQGLPLP
jgi:hypothetical protein